jgi:hypothetical protein
VASAYPGPSDTWVWSPGLAVEATAESWPAPVVSLDAEGREDGRVRLRWTATGPGQDRLVPWSRLPVAPGQDVSRLLDRIPAGLAGEPGTSGKREVELVPPPGAATRITAVSVLGQRAVAGPSVLIETPGTVTDLAVHRVDDGGVAEVRFRWPEPAVLVLVTWEHDGMRYERRVSRSSCRTDGVRIPVGRGAARVAVTPLTRPDAAVAMAGTASALLEAAKPSLAAGASARLRFPVTGPGQGPGPGGPRLSWWRRLSWRRLSRWRRSS